MRRERALQFCACIGWTALLRWRLSACPDGEARPCSGDDDESLRDTRRLPAARFPQPSAHRSLIAFTAWSSFAHATVMGVQAFQSFIARRELLGVATFIVIGVALIALAPAKQPAKRISPVAA